LPVVERDDYVAFDRGKHEEESMKKNERAGRGATVLKVRSALKAGRISANHNRRGI